MIDNVIFVELNHLKINKKGPKMLKLCSTYTLRALQLVYSKTKYCSLELYVKCYLRWSPKQSFQLPRSYHISPSPTDVRVRSQDRGNILLLRREICSLPSSTVRLYDLRIDGQRSLTAAVNARAHPMRPLAIQLHRLPGIQPDIICCLF